MRKRVQPEYELHCAVVAHLRARAVPGLVFFHVPNGGYRNVREAARFKAMGVRAGVPDLLLFHRAAAYALELKSPKGRLSPAQEQFLDDWDAAGCFYAVLDNIDTVIAQLECWGLLRPALSMGDILKHVYGLA